MTDYSTGKIYKLTSNQTDDIYIGSTVCKLCKRMTKHRNDYKRYNNGKHHYVSSFEIVKYDDCKIILVELFPCNSREELTAREQHHIDNTQCINKSRAYTGLTITEYQKQYREDNKEILKEKNKQYREDNREKVIEYYQNNKETINNRQKEKVYCQYCNTYGNRSEISRHNKSYKHIINFINY